MSLSSVSLPSKLTELKEGVLGTSNLSRSWTEVVGNSGTYYL